MIYISEETFEQLSPDLQKQAMEDDKAFRTEEGKEAPGRPGEEMDDEMMAKKLNEEDEKGAPEEKKSYDHASDKGMTLLVAMGKPKKKGMPEEE